jgi:hypothetical protein
MSLSSSMIRWWWWTCMRRVNLISIDGKGKKGLALGS